MKKQSPAPQNLRMAPPGRKIPLGDTKGGRWPHRPPFEKKKRIPPPAAAREPFRNTTAAGGGRGWADGGKKERDEPPPRQNLRIAPPGRKVPLGDAKGGRWPHRPPFEKIKDPPPAAAGAPLRHTTAAGGGQGEGRWEGRWREKLGKRGASGKSDPPRREASHLRKSSMG